jgi:single-strand DNA-binding protein
MAFDFQHFTAVCRLTRDPEPPKVFNGGRSVVRFSVAFAGERRKEGDEWVDKPVFLECEVWQGEKGRKLVDTIMKYGHKGLRVHVSGKFKMETWNDKNTGAKRSALRLTVDDFILLEKVEANQPTDQGYGGDDDSGSAGSGYGGTGDGGGYGQSTDPIPF